MTPASALSRLEKLAEKYAHDEIYPAVPQYDKWKELGKAFIAGGKALLQILSEPGEACGPRDEDVPSRIWVKGLNGKYCLNTSIATPLEGWSSPKEGSLEFIGAEEVAALRAKDLSRIGELEKEAAELMETIKRLSK